MISTETEMDTFHKKDDIDVWSVEKVITPLEVLEPVPSMN